MSKVRRKYTKEFKLTVLREYGNGVKIAQLSREYEVDPSLIFRWKKEHQDNPTMAFSGNGNLYKEQAKVAELERLLGQSYAEISFLKKTLSTLEAKLQEQRKQGELR